MVDVSKQTNLESFLIRSLVVSPLYYPNVSSQDYKNPRAWGGLDGTKKVVIQEEVRDSFFHSIVKNIPAALAIFDENLNYLVTSARWLENTGLLPERIIGRNMYEVVPDIPKKWKKFHARALNGESIKSDEDTFKRKNGKVEWFRWEVLPWYKNETEIGGIILFVEQITQRKKLESDMQKMIEALNQSNAELDRFAHICAHDLNEPLRTIANYSELLTEEIQESLTPESKRYLSNIHKSVKHMNSLISGVLTYSQIGSQKLRKRKLSLNEVMESVALTLQTKIQAKKAQMIIPDNLSEVFGDAALIAQLLQNLVSNALKYNESDHPLVEISATDKGRFSLISVRDNGIGIDSKYHKSIFRIFSRLHSNKEYAGTGIGLCTCKKIAEAHGGKIWVETPPEGGSIFYFSLPKKGVKP